MKGTNAIKYSIETAGRVKNETFAKRAPRLGANDLQRQPQRAVAPPQPCLRPRRAERRRRALRRAHRRGVDLQREGVLLTRERVGAAREVARERSNARVLLLELLLARTLRGRGSTRGDVGVAFKGVSRS